MLRGNKVKCYPNPHFIRLRLLSRRNDSYASMPGELFRSHTSLQVSLRVAAGGTESYAALTLAIYNPPVGNLRVLDDGKVVCDSEKGAKGTGTNFNKIGFVNHCSGALER